MSAEIHDRLVQFLTTDPFYKETMPDHLTDDYNLLDSGILDSIGILNLIVFLESAFHVSIGIDELSENNFLNIHRIVQFVESKINSR